MNPFFASQELNGSTTITPKHVFASLRLYADVLNNILDGISTRVFLNLVCRHNNCSKQCYALRDDVQIVTVKVITKHNLDG